MPSVARHVKLHAEETGLRINYGASQDRHNTALLPWRDAAQEPLAAGTEAAGLSSRGAIGILEAFGTAYLVIITSAQVVAVFRGKEIYKITGVATIPLSSQYEASIALAGLNASKRTENEPLAFLAGAFDAEEAEDDYWQETKQQIVRSRRNSQIRRNGSGVKIAEEVFRATGVQGKEQGRDAVQRSLQADRDKSKPHKRSISMSAERPVRPRLPSRTPSDVIDREEKAINVMPRVVLCLRKLLSSGCFFFSYDVDLTRRLATHQDVALNRQHGARHLWQRADDEYFWNRHLSSELIGAGHDTLILPIIQGFVGQRHIITFDNGNIESTSDQHEVFEGTAVEVAGEDPWQLTLISRRSTHRNGLRYLKRGIDKHGSVANFVETEQLLVRNGVEGGDSPALSFVQIRGSIPLYFTQCPALKAPVPRLRKGAAANADAFARHLHDLKDRYGDVHMLSLINRHGREGAIGEAFENQARICQRAGVASKSRSNLSFDWFDFHELCKGMKFENVSGIVEHMHDFLSRSAWTATQAGAIERHQAGVVRTNCMDCLDRTNVVQAALAQHVLEQQLSSSTGQELKLASSGSTAWYDSLWADNGDAISTAYTSTGAMKGDYVRTRTRNWRGVLNDGIIAISRYYYNLITDFFLQAVIDLCLGSADEQIFEELENGKALQMIEREYEHDEEQERQVLRGFIAADGVVAGWLLDEHGDGEVKRTLLLLVEDGIDRIRYDWAQEVVQTKDHASARDVEQITWGPVSSTGHDSSFGFTIKVAQLEWTFTRPPSMAARKSSQREEIEQLVSDIRDWVEECSSSPVQVTEQAHAIAAQQVGWLDWLSSSAQSIVLG